MLTLNRRLLFSMQRLWRFCRRAGKNFTAARLWAIGIYLLDRLVVQSILCHPVWITNSSLSGEFLNVWYRVLSFRQRITFCLMFLGLAGRDWLASLLTSIHTLLQLFVVQWFSAAVWLSLSWQHMLRLFAGRPGGFSVWKRFLDAQFWRLCFSFGLALVPVRFVPSNFPTGGGDNFFYPHSWTDVYWICYYLYNYTGYLRWAGLYKDDAALLYNLNALLPDYLKYDVFQQALHVYITGHYPLAFLDRAAIAKLEQFFFPDFVFYVMARHSRDPLFFSRLLLDEKFCSSVLSDYFVQQFFFAFANQCPTGVIYNVADIAAASQSFSFWLAGFVNDVSLLFYYHVAEPFLLFLTEPGYFRSVYLSSGQHPFYATRRLVGPYLDVTHVTPILVLSFLYVFLCLWLSRWLTIDSPTGFPISEDDDMVDYQSPRFYFNEFKDQVRWNWSRLADFDVLAMVMVLWASLYRYKSKGRHYHMAQMHIIRFRSRLAPRRKKKKNTIRRWNGFIFVLLRNGFSRSVPNSTRARGWVIH